MQMRGQLARREPGLQAIAANVIRKSECDSDSLAVARTVPAKMAPTVQLGPASTQLCGLGTTRPIAPPRTRKRPWQWNIQVEGNGSNTPRNIPQRLSLFKWPSHYAMARAPARSNPTVPPCAVDCQSHGGPLGAAAARRPRLGPCRRPFGGVTAGQVRRYRMRCGSPAGPSKST